jgi:hypothetical protein
MILVEVVSICATLVPIGRAKRRRLGRLRDGPDGLFGRRLAEALP